MRRWGLLRLVLLVTVGLSLAIKLAHSKVDDVEDDDDIWEDIEDDEEPVVSSTNSRVSQSALVQLNDQNLETILKSNEYVMLLGYASWCRQSAAVMVYYAEAALTLKAKGSPVVLARVDAIVNTVTAGRYKIKGYPTVMFFRNGSEEIYPGGLSSEEIVNWIQKQTGHPTTTISREEDAKEILRRKQTALVVGYFEKFEGSEYEDFVAASMEVADVEFVQTTVAEVAVLFKPEMVKKAPSIGLFDSEDGFEQMDSPLTKDAIVVFANLCKYPMVTKLHSQNVAKVYSSPLKKHVILFASEDEFEDVYDFYKLAAMAFKNKLMFVWVDTADEDFAKPMLTMYGIPGDEAVVTGFDNNNGSRYLMDAEVTQENLVLWAEKYFQGLLDLHYKSEKIPKDNIGDVKVIVGKTFGSLVLERSTDVVLLVCTPYGLDCESMGKVFPKVAKHFKGNSSLIFGKLDASANEHPALKVTDFPAILFYSASSGSKKPIVGPTKPYFKKLVKFVEEQLEQSSSSSDLNKEAACSETTTEVSDGHDSVSASLITGAESLKTEDVESWSTEAVPDASFPTETVMDLVDSPTSDADRLQVQKPEDGSTETISEVSLPTAIEVDSAVGLVPLELLTFPAKAAVADSSRSEQRLVAEDMNTKYPNKDTLIEATVAYSPRTEHRPVEDKASDKSDLSMASTQAPVVDYSPTDRRAVPEKREVQDLNKDETSYKDEL